ncbi:MAG: signal peptidase II [Treponema sp.]|nr:signal peptidase II [Treponema sp.]
MNTDTIAVEFKQKKLTKNKLIPLILIVLVVILDQISKQLIVKNIDLTYPPSVGFSFLGDFFRIIHVCNPGIAFSIGQGWSFTARALLFRLLPLIVLTVVLVIYFKNDEFSQLQRWSIAGIIGGGFGNLIDRFFRAEGVVDFIDIKFYGLFGMERWPTFNIADSSVVICGILLLISFLYSGRKAVKE